ncbi:hypothetical protein [Terricaulis sp.]|uniref:hypothetical protein n=1 Tax=Terricaulis sp. TaxID=2768686 RepID=UPI002AC63527|nr:hypothetical protein [Terricaulis sp.]MDZ4692854.1 hypothetical protein [Terricaulis sp.]
MIVFRLLGALSAGGAIYAVLAALVVGFVGWLALRQNRMRLQYMITALTFAGTLAVLFMDEMGGAIYLALGRDDPTNIALPTMYAITAAAILIGGAIGWFAQKRWVLALALIGFALGYALLFTAMVGGI